MVLAASPPNGRFHPGTSPETSSTSSEAQLRATAERANSRAAGRSPWSWSWTAPKPHSIRREPLRASRQYIQPCTDTRVSCEDHSGGLPRYLRACAAQEPCQGRGRRPRRCAMRSTLDATPVLYEHHAAGNARKTVGTKAVSLWRSPCVESPQAPIKPPSVTRRFHVATTRTAVLVCQ